MTEEKKSKVSIKNNASKISVEDGKIKIKASEVNLASKGKHASQKDD